MSEFFNFEADFVGSLRCIPMQVRYKLDTCGVKLKLTHWHQFNPDERRMLVEKPCTTAADLQAYRDTLQGLVTYYTGTPAGTLPLDPAPAWLNSEVIPEETQAKAQEFNTTLTLEQWRSLTPLQRFALIKLSRPGHENKNFLPALKEFNLQERAEG